MKRIALASVLAASFISCSSELEAVQGMTIARPTLAHNAAGS